MRIDIQQILLTNKSLTLQVYPVLCYTSVFLLRYPFESLKIAEAWWGNTDYKGTVILQAFITLPSILTTSFNDVCSWLISSKHTVCCILVYMIIQLNT